MQKPRNSDCLLIKPMHGANTALALLGLMLSCPLVAQDAGNAKAETIDVVPTKPIVKAEEGEHAQKTPEPIATESKPTSGYDLSTLSQVTMEQSIEAVRKRKLRELAEALRAQLGEKAPNAVPAPVPNTISLPTDKLPEAVELSSAPRLWSLTASGNRVWAEVWLDGKIIQVDSMDGRLIQLDSGERLPELGSWSVLSLTSDGMVLGRPIKVAAKKGKYAMQQERMLLRPSARGISAMTYKFGVAATSALPESAQRATQLPSFQSGTQK